MKKTDEKFDLDELLRTVEHAGRDNRRQQQLSDLIDSLAADEESAHRKVLWRRWSIGISAAACLVLFVTTIVKFTAQDASQPTGALVAETPVVHVREEATVQEEELRTKTVYENGNENKGLRAKTKSLTEDEELPIAENEATVPIEKEEIVEDTLIDEYDIDVQYADKMYVPGSEDMIPVDTGSDTNIGREHAEVETRVAKHEEKSEKKSRRWFQLRRANPSKMDGTMLAFRLN